MDESKLVSCHRNSGVIVPTDGAFRLRGIDFPFDPRMSPLPNSAPFDAFGSSTVSAGDTTSLITVDLGRAEWAVIRRLGMEILDDPAGAAITGFSNTIWRIKVNGVPVEFYGQIVDQIGTGLADRDVIFLIDQPRARITAEVENIHDSDSFLCFWTFAGWTIPIPGS